MQLEIFVSAFALGVFVFSFFSIKSLAIFQQCSYRIREFLPVIFKRRKGEFYRLLAYSLAFCLILPLHGIIIAFDKNKLSYLYFLVLVAFSGVYFLRSKVIKQPKFTNRYLRIYVISAVLYGLLLASVMGLIFQLKGAILFLICLGFCLAPLSIPFLICLSKIVNYPYDKARYEISKIICKRKLTKNKALIKIGITGSFGKTSVKNYLEKMLLTKYRVLTTPKSYNTPLGICKTVKGGVKNYDVFIVEMGARYPGDIKELCKIVKPNVGIITGVACQHTETLGGIENVVKAKNQLIEALSGEGFAVFSMQNTYSKQMFYKAQVVKYGVGKEKTCFVYYQKFKQLTKGISFEIVVDKKVYHTFAPLLGEHNALNICLAVAISLNLGVDIKRILSVIPTLDAVEHRASLITAPNGITVIDDGYNANIEGIKSTANAVDVFEGFKIAVTSGIVETGESEEKINFEVGQVLAGHFDLIVAVGVNAYQIQQGAQTLNKEVVIVEQTKEAKNVITARAKRGDTVAFFNDLTDRY